MSRRYTDNDRNWGPFLFARTSGGRTAGMYLEAVVDEDRDAKYNVLHLELYRGLLRVHLPAWVKPHHEDREFFSKRFGFYVYEGHFVVLLGAQTNDSTTTKNWSAFLPWTQWRFLGESWFWPETGEEACFMSAGTSYDFRRQHQPSMTAQAVDRDGTVVTATIKSTERFWRFGTKWCSWMGWLRPARRSRSIDVSFNHEVGARKGSFKGGLMGTSVEPLAGESALDAFKRLCVREGLTCSTPS